MSPTIKIPSLRTTLKAETTGLIPLLICIDLIEALRFFSIVTLNPYPFLIIVIIFASFSAYGLIALLITIAYLLWLLFSHIITEADFVIYLITTPFIVLLINLMKFSLHSRFNPKLELNFEKIKEDAEVEETKKEFISLAAHQLRTPLGAIRWNIEGLLTNKKAIIDSTTKKTITEVYASTLHMITLVNDLLDINKLLRGQALDENHAINLNETITSLVNDVTYLTHEHSISLTYQSNSVLPVVSLDPKSLHEVLLNLVTNAIKYSQPNGKVTITTAVKGHEIIVSIQDSGIGIEKADKEKLFEKFYRGTNALKQVSEGSGLGLYLVKLLVNQWGGRVWFESEINKGSQFYFSIPI